MKRMIAIASIFLPLSGAAFAQDRTPSPDGASAYIISPADGDTVSSPVTVVFGLSGMGVAPAGTEKKNTGHHHLLIDTAQRLWTSRFQPTTITLISEVAD